MLAPYGSRAALCILTGILCVLAMPELETFEKLWIEGPENNLCGREQAKAWALREVWREQGKGQHGMYAFIASKVKKTKNGKPRGDNPSGQSIKELFDKIN